MKLEPILPAGMPALALRGLTVFPNMILHFDDPAFREQFDFAVSRAVAELRTLCELCLPYVKVGGTFLAMKSVDAGAELAAAGPAIKLLGGDVEAVTDYQIPGTDVRHRLILIKKIGECPK